MEKVSRKGYSFGTICPSRRGESVEEGLLICGEPNGRGRSGEEGLLICDYDPQWT